MITVSESAKNKILDLLTEENNPNLKLRTFVQGGGCSGFNYGFTFDEEPLLHVKYRNSDQKDDDFEISLGEYKVLVDAMSMTYLQGSEIDYKEELLGANFTIKNPNAQNTCGCGSSFSVSDEFYDDIGH